MEGPLENLYFQWLCAKVTYVRNPTPSLTCWNLLKILHSTEFVWLLSGDDNRAKDGLELRIEFLFEGDIPDNQEWRSLGCSVLEMLIAFSRRAEFMTDIPSSDWFWEFLDNLGLKQLNDGADIDLEEVEGILDRFIWRTYNSKGDGGLFPLNETDRDQRTVEIWYQFCEYLVDQDRMP
jgi:hypothetical protein